MLHTAQKTETQHVEVKIKGVWEKGEVLETSQFKKVKVRFENQRVIPNVSWFENNEIRRKWS